MASIQRQVQTVKKAEKEPSLALLSSCSTLSSAKLRSPAELLNGRMFKATLLMKILPPETRDLLSTQQRKQVNFYNRDLDKCQISVKFKLYKFKILKCLARIVGFGLTPRSYITEDESGVE